MKAFELKGRNLGLYIHIPFCISKCSYCDFFSLPLAPYVPQSYVDALCNEIRESFYGSDCLVDSVYVGGGTPSLLSEIQIKQLFDCIRKNAHLSEDCEITIEVNPDDVNKNLLLALKDAGVNRISCGIQSFNDSVLTFCKRRASAQVNKNALDCIKTYWNGKLSLDLICAMPLESEESFLQGLKLLTDIKPEHISMYSLTIEDETPLGKLIEKGSLLYDYDLADKMWLSGRDFLENSSYVQYEVSNFCLAGNECRHNMKYWTRSDYIGCGCGATGTLYFPGGKAVRQTNVNDVDLYTAYWLSSCREKEKLPFILENIDEKDGEFEFFMMALRKIAGFSDSDYKKHFLRPLPQSFLSVFEKWQKKNLAFCKKDIDDCVYTLGKEGIIYLNSFLKELI